MYVQHILQEDMESVGEMIYSKGGHVYVCGDVTMASDVSKILTNLLQEYAALSDQEAKDYISGLRVCNIFIVLIIYQYMGKEIYSLCWNFR